MSYVAKIEPLTACLRVYREEESSNGSPYIMAATVSYASDGTTAMIKGVTSTPGHSFTMLRSAITKALKLQGVEEVVYIRHRPGKSARTVRLLLR